MEKYKLKFWFEHGGICFWSMNDIAHDKYGYPIETSMLPISEALIKRFDELEEEYSTYLDWEYPLNPSPWTEEHKKDFIRRATEAYNNICRELGENYIVENIVASCVI